MAKVPKHDGGRGGITAFVVEADSPGITVENRNAFMGLQGHRERRHPVPPGARAGREPARQGGPGPQDRADHPQHRPAVDPGDLRRRRQVVPQDRPRVVRRAGAVGPPVGEHEAVAQKLSFMAATTFALEAVLELSAQLADAGTKDIRIEAALAKLWASEMAWQIADELVQIRGGRGYETADSLRGPRRARRARRAAAARPADQPDLRGIHRDHAPADRPRGGRHPPHRRRATSPRPTPACGRRPRRRSTPAASTPGGCRSWWPARAAMPTSYAEFGPLARHLRYRRALVAQARPADLLRHGPLAGQARAPAGLPRPASSTSAPSCSRWRPPCTRAEMIRVRGPRAGRGGLRARRGVLRAVAASDRGRCSTSCGTTPTTSTSRSRAGSSPASTPGSRRVSSTRRRAPARGSPSGPRDRRRPTTRRAATAERRVGRGRRMTRRPLTTRGGLGTRPLATRPRPGAHAPLAAASAVGSRRSSRRRR